VCTCNELHPYLGLGLLYLLLPPQLSLKGSNVGILHSQQIITSRLASLCEYWLYLLHWKCPESMLHTIDTAYSHCTYIQSMPYTLMYECHSPSTNIFPYFHTHLTSSDWFLLCTISSSVCSEVHLSLSEIRP